MRLAKNNDRCMSCSKTFGRLFILKRHEKMHTRGQPFDPSAPSARRSKKVKCACTNCQAAKQACDEADTCEFCAKRGLICERVPKPASTKRKTGEESMGLAAPLDGGRIVPHPPAERLSKPSARRKLAAPSISIPPCIPRAGKDSTGRDFALGIDGDDDQDMSDASTLRHASVGVAGVGCDTSDTMTLLDGYQSDSLDNSPMLQDDDEILSTHGNAWLSAIDTTVLRAQGHLNLGGFFGDSPKAGPLHGTSPGMQPSSPSATSPSGIDALMLDDYDEVEEDEEERLREQEQLQLIEQETLLRLEEQQRLNEQSAWQVQQMMTA